MARRNRKRKKANTVICPAPLAGIVVVAVSLGLGYVWLGSRCEAVGRDIQALERGRELLGNKYVNEAYRWTRLKSPGNIERALARHGIKMHWPARGQVVRLYDAGDLYDQLAQVSDVAAPYGRSERTVLNE